MRDYFAEHLKCSLRSLRQSAKADRHTAVCLCLVVKPTHLVGSNPHLTDKKIHLKRGVFFYGSG